MNAGVEELSDLHTRLGLSVSGEHMNEPLRECVRIALQRYLQQIGSHSVNDLYGMVLGEVEPPMLEAVLNHCGGNQSRAAQMLGMSRSTLRKKLAGYGLKL